MSNTNLTLNHVLKTAYRNAVATIQATPKFNAMYQRIVEELTARANKGSLMPIQKQVGYELLHAIVDKLNADGLAVSYYNDVVEVRIKIA